MTSPLGIQVLTVPWNYDIIVMYIKEQGVCDMLLNEGLEGMYYILCVDEERDWWQLRKTDDHQVLACGKGKEFVLSALKTQVERYRTKTTFMREWNSMEYRKALSTKEKALRGLEYQQVKDISDEEINHLMTTHKESSFRRRRDIEHEESVIKAEEDIPVPKPNRTLLNRKLIRRRR